MENKDNEFANYIARALNEFLFHMPTKLEHKTPYKFSMNVLFNFENTKLKSMDVCDVQLKKMNKSLNKTKRHETKS